MIYIKRVVEYKKRMGYLSVIFIIAIACKIFQYTALPRKYFIDSNKILAMIEDSSIVRNMSYVFTSNFFRAINIFKIDNLVDWSLLITIIFSVVFFLILLKYKELTISEFIFIYVSLILLNIFSFNLSKEVIQIMIFISIYCILVSKKGKIGRKIILINVVLILETIFFREYYILFILAFNIFCYFFIFTKKLKIREMNWIIKALCCIATFLFILGISSTVSPDSYRELIRIRTISENNLAEANTVIINIFKNDGRYYTYVLNYIVNFFRILIPIELLAKNITYIPFILYQVVVSYYIVKALIIRNSKNILTIGVVFSYFMVSITFEPDFGSVVRHESTLFILLLLMKKGTPSSKKDSANGKVNLTEGK